MIVRVYFKEVHRLKGVEHSVDTRWVHDWALGNGAKGYHIDAILVNWDEVLAAIQKYSRNLRLPELEALVPENETPLAIGICIKAHDCEGIDVDCLEAEDQLWGALFPSVNDDVGISYIKLVGVSHQEAHLLKLVLLEGQDEHSKLVVVDVTQNVEYGVNLV